MSAMAELADQLDQHLQGARTIARLVYGDEGDQYVADRLNELMAEGAPPAAGRLWHTIAVAEAVSGPDRVHLGYVGTCTCGHQTVVAASHSGAAGMIVTHASFRHGAHWRWAPDGDAYREAIVLPEVTVTSGVTEPDKPGE